MHDTPAKPRDVGNGLVCASFATDGGWLSLGAAHPVHGFVELTGLPRFDPSWRGDPAAVRRYRGWMAEDRYAFLRLHGSSAVQIEQWAAASEPLLVQRYRLRRCGETASPVVLGYHGRLDRHAYAEITDISPLPPTGTPNRLHIEGNELRIEAPALPATATITIQTEGAHAVAWSPKGHYSAELVIDRGGARRLLITICCTLRTSPRSHRTDPGPAPCIGAASHQTPPRGWTPAGTGSGRPRMPRTLQPRLARIIDGTIDYIFGCTALRVAEREVCIVTDNRILPLSWTRDAYYQALLLLCAASQEPRAAPTVADHLRWLWCRSRDPRGSWMRSHLTNGQVKDHGLQADQQLYPLLELCDYRRVTGAWPDLDGCIDTAAEQLPAAWSAMVAQVWTQLPRDERTGLLASQENPADDPSAFPYTLSTQILYWYTAIRLLEWQSELDLGGLALAATARRVMHAVDQHFTAAGPFGAQWAYESDLRGQGRLYNDANDLPTALAPLWGFCAPSSPRWAATMRYTFSEHNPAYNTGAYGGLGSAHTPGTWPLGDLQQWVAASLLGRTQCSDAAISRLALIAAPDGLLPEAYDPDTGAWRARHWFTWPSAALGALYLSSIDTKAPWRPT